jgi:hypothetical protein
VDAGERGLRVVEIPSGFFTRTMRLVVRAVQAARVGEVLAIRTDDP